MRFVYFEFLKTGFMYRYLGKRLNNTYTEEAIQNSNNDATAKSNIPAFVYRVGEIDNVHNDSEDDENHEDQFSNGGVGTEEIKKRIVSQRQLNLFQIDQGDTIIWQKCMRLKGLENTMSKAEIESQHLKAWFTKFDKDSSLTLDQKEFGYALKEMVRSKIQKLKM